MSAPLWSGSRKPHSSREPSMSAGTRKEKAPKPPGTERAHECEFESTNFPTSWLCVPISALNFISDLQTTVSVRTIIAVSSEILFAGLLVQSFVLEVSCLCLAELLTCACLSEHLNGESS
jgi:hypothetical protein